MNIFVDEGCFKPVKAHDEDAGYDLRTPSNQIVPAHESAVIDTGVHFEIPKGYYGKLESKSGLNVNHGVVCLGGVIDSGYTGSVMVKLYNLSDYDYIFSKGDKVVQIIFLRHISPEMVLVDKFKETNRGNNGFGSSGK